MSRAPGTRRVSASCFLSVPPRPQGSSLPWTFFISCAKSLCANRVIQKPSVTVAVRRPDLGREEGLFLKTTGKVVCVVGTRPETWLCVLNFGRVQDIIDVEPVSRQRALWWHRLSCGLYDRYHPVYYSLLITQGCPPFSLLSLWICQPMCLGGSLIPGQHSGSDCHRILV